MPETLITGLLLATAAYLAAGILAAFWLQTRALARLDPTAAHGTRGFRLLVFPGLVLLWPVMLIKARRALRGDSHAPEAEHPIAPRCLRLIHGAVFIFLALAIPALLAAALWWRHADNLSASTRPTENFKVPTPPDLALLISSQSPAAPTPPAPKTH